MRRTFFFFQTTARDIAYSFTAITSISTKPFFGNVLTATAERAGNVPSNWEAYTSFIAAKSLISARNTVVFTTSLMPSPASSKIACTFLNACTVCSFTPPTGRKQTAYFLLVLPDYTDR